MYGGVVSRVNTDDAIVGSYPVVLNLMANASGIESDVSLAPLWAVLSDLLLVDLTEVIVSRVGEGSDPNAFQRFLIIKEHNEREDWSLYEDGDIDDDDSVLTIRSHGF